MPFTFSHPAAVLPLAFIKKKWVSVTALVIGSMIPDFEYFFNLEQDSIYSHTWGGMFWFDLPLALLVVYLFNYLIKNDLIQHLPEFLNKRFSKFESSTRNLNDRKEFVVVVFSLLIGITSHIIWDKLTHKTVRLIDEQEHYTVFWEANSLVGASVIAAVVLNMRRGRKTQKNNILFYWLLISTITASFIYVRFLATTEIRDLGVSAISGFFTGLIVTSIIEKVWKRVVRTVSSHLRLFSSEEKGVHSSTLVRRTFFKLKRPSTGFADGLFEGEISLLTEVCFQRIAITCFL